MNDAIKAAQKAYENSKRNLARAEKLLATTDTDYRAKDQARYDKKLAAFRAAADALIEALKS